MKFIKKGNIFNDHHSQVPVVDKNNNDFWRIYYSTRDDLGRSIPMYFDIEPGNPKKILNKSNKPILSLGDYGMFDHRGIMPTCIVENGNDKFLYYIGWTNRVDVPYHNAIGLAISKNNGDSWEKFSEGPVLGTSCLEPGFTGTISVMEVGGEWYGWYMSCRKWVKINNKMEPFYDLKLAKSKDGINWVPTNITCITLKDGEGGISQASVIKKDGVFKMWFSYRGTNDYRNNKETSYKIGYAESIDGVVWERSTEPFLDSSIEGWDSEMVCYPNTIIYNNKQFLFYNGNGFGKTGIGYGEIIK